MWFVLPPQRTAKKDRNGIFGHDRPRLAGHKKRFDLPRVYFRLRRDGRPLAYFCIRASDCRRDENVKAPTRWVQFGQFSTTVFLLAMQMFSYHNGFMTVLLLRSGATVRYARECLFYGSEAASVPCGFLFIGFVIHGIRLAFSSLPRPSV
ncbi:hypothetical protein ACNKHL_12755 [Shigella flexneri]